MNSPSGWLFLLASYASVVALQTLVVSIMNGNDDIQGVIRVLKISAIVTLVGFGAVAVLAVLLKMVGA
jgi:hypothetical protein